MEDNPFGHHLFEAPDESADKPDKESKKAKKKLSAEKPVESKKERAGRDIARSIETGSLFAMPEDKKDKPAQTDQAEQATEPESVEVLSQEETEHIQQETAQNHLEAIAGVDEQAAQELEPASDFLELVAEGRDPEAAFAEVAGSEGASPDEIQEMLHTSEEVEDEREDLPSRENFDTNADGVIDPSERHEGVVDWRPSSSRTMPSPAAPPRAAVVPPTPAGAATVPPRPAPGATAMPAAAAEHYHGRYDSGDMLLIGFVGYLIGRRRGRIKAEKRLLPVQKKLEKQVSAIEADITRKEQQLVAICAEKHPADIKAVAPRPERTQPGRTETRIGMEKPVRAERLGRMVVTAEAPSAAPHPEKSSHIREAFSADYVPRMSRAELLEVSEKIIIEGASLRKIYESNLVGEKQLRHLVREHLQGKDIRKDLRREMVEHEIDFERDPQLRDRVRSQLSSDSNGGALSDMLAKAGVIQAASDSQLDRQQQKDADRRATKLQQTKRRRAAADTAMITAIVVLAAAVAFLLLR